MGRTVSPPAPGVPFFRFDDTPHELTVAVVEPGVKQWRALSQTFYVNSGCRSVRRWRRSLRDLT